jgi:uncharacterized membrane protein
MMILYILAVFALVITVFMCLQESKKRKIAFISALLLCILTTPIIGYLIISSRPLRNARGCKWCLNDANEAEYCGLCGKNDAGLTR